MNPVVLGVVLLTLSAVAITAIWVYANLCVFRGRSEVADVPELPPCGVRILLTEEQVERSIAEIEKHFTVKTRRIR